MAELNFQDLRPKQQAVVELVYQHGVIYTRTLLANHNVALLFRRTRFTPTGLGQSIIDLSKKGWLVEASDSLHYCLTPAGRIAYEAAQPDAVRALADIDTNDWNPTTPAGKAFWTGHRVGYMAGLEDGKWERDQDVVRLTTENARLTSELAAAIKAQKAARLVSEEGKE